MTLAFPVSSTVKVDLTHIFLSVEGQGTLCKLFGLVNWRDRGMVRFDFINFKFK